MLAVSRQSVWNKMLVVKMNKKVKQKLVRMMGLDIENRLRVEVCRETENIILVVCR